MASLTRAWRWRPRSRRAVVLSRIATAAILFLFAALVLRDARYGGFFAAALIVVGIPLDLFRLRRDRRQL